MSWLYHATSRLHGSMRHNWGMRITHSNTPLLSHVRAIPSPSGPKNQGHCWASLLCGSVWCWTCRTTSLSSDLVHTPTGPHWTMTYHKWTFIPPNTQHVSCERDMHFPYSAWKPGSWLSRSGVEVWGILYLYLYLLGVLAIRPDPKSPQRLSQQWSTMYTGESP